jgi:hypothetical protein
VVVVVVLGARPEGNPMPRAPREIVARVGLDRLEEPSDNPDVDGDDVKLDASLNKGRQLGRRQGKEEGTADCSGAEDEDLERVGVLGREAEGSRELVVELVDVLRRARKVEAGVASASADTEEADRGRNGGREEGKRTL